jgi:S-formylglutathione hydrolase FrmB
MLIVQSIIGVIVSPWSTGCRGGWRAFLFIGTALSGIATGFASGQTPSPPGRESSKTAQAHRDAATKGPAFEIAYPSLLKDKPITARVYVMLGPGGSGLEPRLGPSWFHPQPFFSTLVEDWKPGESVRVDSASAGFPGPLDSLKPADYAAQAVIRLNLDTHDNGSGEGNAYGPVIHTRLEPGTASPIRLEVDALVPPREFRETNRIKLAELDSPLLSAFYHRPIKHRAAVILPAEGRTLGLPALYIVPGFGGDHHMASAFLDVPALRFGQDLVRIVLDPDCGTGHHVFADSATNGPRGKALIEEFIPYLEKTFSLVAQPRARLLSGHSSGGWSSLWLQVAHPDFFGGTWSTSPDPVDFRDFQQINIYAPGENMFRDRQGRRRPIARTGDRPVIYYDDFSRMEDVMGPGGQLGSFEAVFSPMGPDGQPRRLWNRSSGAIDPDVARAWEAHDIRLVLERNWETLGSKLRGKLHVIVGGMDTFYLEGAVGLLKDALARLKSDAEVEIIPGRDHGTVLDAAMAARIDREMKATVAPFLPPREAK